jgi:hypothetical protein
MRGTGASGGTVAPGSAITRGPAVAVVLALALATGCSSATPAPAEITDPTFTDPVVKIAETGDTMAFSETLFAEYTYQDPTLLDPAATQNLYLTFYGGANQRGLALSFLDTVAYYSTRRPDKPRALWIQGGVLNSVAWQYATYRLTSEWEHWSDRARAEDPTGTGSPLGNQVTIHGVTYADPHPVTAAQVSAIWSNYSAAYADLSRLFHARAIPVHARAFIDYPNGTLNKYSGFWAECRQLRQLVSAGQVQEFLCAARSFPAYGSLDPSDWKECPPCPAAVTVVVRSGGATVPGAEVVMSDGIDETTAPPTPTGVRATQATDGVGQAVLAVPRATAQGDLCFSSLLPIQGGYTFKRSCSGMDAIPEMVVLDHDLTDLP